MEIQQNILVHAIFTDNIGWRCNAEHPVYNTYWQLKNVMELIE